MKQNKKSLKKYQKILLVLFSVFIIIQFIPSEKTNPPVTGELKMPANIKALFTKSCFDCHSNETVWPWYGYVAPASWLIIKDVKEGREHLNFSEWNTIEPKKQNKIFEEIWEEVSEDKMPLGIYTIMHSDAKLSPNDKEVIKKWAFNLKRLWD